MTKIRKPSTFAPSPDTYVASTMTYLGIAERTAGYVPHILMQVALSAVATVFCEQFASQIVFKNLLNTRKRALRHMAKNQ